MRTEIHPTRLWLLAIAGSVLVALGLLTMPTACAQDAGDVAPAQAEPAAADEPAMEADAAEEPAADEPTAEEPAAEEMADDAFGDAAEEEAAPAARPRARPTTSAAPAGPKPPDDPAVLAILESHPETPAELLRAIDILIDLGHAANAKAFADSLAKAKINQAGKAALAAQFNSAKLLKLARNPELGKVLGPFVDDLLQNAEAYRRDPKRLAEWANQLSSNNDSVRAQATLALTRAGEAAVAPLVAILANPKKSQVHARAHAILVQLDDLAVPPLLGVLDSPNVQLKTQVIQILGEIHATQAVSQLLGPSISPASTPELRAAARQALANIGGHAPSAPEALRLLEHAVERSLAQSRTDVIDGPPTVEVWHWNAKRNESMPITYDPAGASLAVAARLARELYQLDPDNPAHRRQYLTTMLQAAKYRVGLDKPLPAGPGTARTIASQYGADVIQEVMVYAMTQGYFPAATAAAEILGDIGNAGLLAGGGAELSPMARAAQSPDRRLRFAAIETIMKWQPSEPFAGSSQVADGLAFFASSYGVPRILVVHPLSAQGQKIAALAAGLGYQTDVATNGRRAFELATASPDYDFVMIHSAIDRPRVDDLLAQLRRDKRTSQLSVGLIAPIDDVDRVKHFAEINTRTEAFLQPQNAPEMKIFADQLLGRAGRTLVAHAERRQQAIAALDALIVLAGSPQQVFDIRRLEPAVLRVLYVPELTSRVVKLLGELGTASSQRALVELADSSTQPLAARQAAVAALTRSMEEYGTLLESAEIVHQYDLYNANAGRDADSSAVLSSILDLIEHKSKSANTETTGNETADTQ